MLNVIFDRMATTSARTSLRRWRTPSYFSFSSVGSSRRVRHSRGLRGRSRRGGVLRAGVGRPDSDRISTAISSSRWSKCCSAPMARSRRSTCKGILQRRASRCADAARTFGKGAAVVIRRDLGRSRSIWSGSRPNGLSGDRPAATTWAVYAKILLQGLDRGGEMFIVIPHSALNPLRAGALSYRVRRIGLHGSELEQADCRARFSAPRWC